MSQPCLDGIFPAANVLDTNARLKNGKLGDKIHKRDKHTARLHLMCLDLAVSRYAEQREVDTWTNDRTRCSARRKLQTRHKDLVRFA